MMTKPQAFRLAQEWDYLLWRCECIANGTHADGDPVRLKAVADDYAAQVKAAGYDVYKFIPSRSNKGMDGKAGR
jgi:hypothetical protein